MHELQQLTYLRSTPSGFIPFKRYTSTQLILDAAKELGVKYKIIPGTPVIELEYQQKKSYFRDQVSTHTNDVGFFICQHKDVTKTFLNAAGLSTPKGYKIISSDSTDFILEVIHSLKKPLIVKPSDGFQGRHVRTDLEDDKEIIRVVQETLKTSNSEHFGVLIEEMFDGQEYRVLLNREKVLAVAQRIPANVIGDGISTIMQLIDKKNRDPRRKDDPFAALVKIKLGSVEKKCLADQGFNPNFIPKENQQIFLRKNSNISTGGDSIDITDEIHSSVSEICLNAIRALPNIDFVGIDFMTRDILKQQNTRSYVILEVNTSPGFSIHEFPYHGKPRNTQYEFLFSLFPQLSKTEQHR